MNNQKIRSNVTCLAFVHASDKLNYLFPHASKYLMPFCRFLRFYIRVIYFVYGSVSFKCYRNLDVSSYWKFTVNIAGFYDLAAFKGLGKMILDVGLMLAYHCDRYGKCMIFTFTSFWPLKWSRFFCPCIWYGTAAFVSGEVEEVKKWAHFPTFLILCYPKWPSFLNFFKNVSLLPKYVRLCSNFTSLHPPFPTSLVHSGI